jgi:hypothetical protein
MFIKKKGVSDPPNEPPAAIAGAGSAITLPADGIVISDSSIHPDGSIV